MSDSNALLLCGALLCIFLLFASASPRIEQAEQPKVNVEPLVNRTGENTSLPFTIRVTHVNLANILVGYSSYVPSWRTILQDLGVNTLRLWDGGGSTPEINMVDYPATWATNLLNILDMINPDRTGATGFKVYFQCLDQEWAAMLGIACYDLGNSDGRTPALISVNDGGAGWVINALTDRYRYSLTTAAEIAGGYSTTKTYIDKLSGDNPESYNFFTDPRILTWPTGNECFYGDGVTVNVQKQVYDWTIAVNDYIASKGGKTTVNCGLYGTPSDPYDDSFASLVPLFSGHADYMEIHQYGVYQLIHNFNLGGGVYDWASWKTWLEGYYTTQLASKGAFSNDAILIGEFGIWHGYSTEWGGATFTDQNVVDFYTNYFEVLANVDVIKWVSFFHCFQAYGGFENFYMVNINGGTLSGYSQIKAAYITNPDPPTPAETLPWAADFTDTTQFTVQQGSWSVAP
jgi:hypothetical protein